MGTLPLFDDPTSFDRVKLATKLRALAEKGIYLGGSSWRYEGWLGQIYTPDRYFTRGRFSKKRFEESCISEYAETFPIVCGDFSFYQFPSDQFWQKLFTAAPPHLKFGLKVPEEITCKSFPTHPRYAARAGLDNPSFLNAELFEAAFLQPLLPYRDRIAVLIFEFGTFSKKAYGEPETFFDDLTVFLAKLPQGFRYSVEIRNQEFLLPEYFQVLRESGIAHVFNAWTRMPPLGSQIQIPDAFTADFTVARALLRQGRPFEIAVQKFSPYTQTVEENPEARTALKDLVERAQRKREPAYLFVNNRLEGNSPLTIQAVVD
jgi:uncharacterized protein YecE (DUF72 family)